MLLVPSWWSCARKLGSGALQEEVPHWRPALRLGKFTPLTVCSQSGNMRSQPPATMPASYCGVSSPWLRLIALKSKVKINSSFRKSLLDFVLYPSRTVTNADVQSCEMVRWLWFQAITFGVVGYVSHRELMQWVASVFLSSLIFSFSQFSSGYHPFFFCPQCLSWPKCMCITAPASSPGLHANTVQWSLLGKRKWVYENPSSENPLILYYLS